MKTHIIHLHPEDDWASVKDQMRRAVGGRILLVWPGSKAMFSRKLDVLTLKRHSQAQGAELIFVTRDPDVRFFAREINLPVFRSLRQAQQAPWSGNPSPPKEMPSAHDPKRLRELQKAVKAGKTSGRKTMHWLRLTAFVCGVLAFVTVIAVLVPAAQIHLQPAIQSQTVLFDVQADDNIKSFNLSGALPIQELSILVETSQTHPSSGEIAIPQSRAGGSVIFTNITDQSGTVPMGTVVRTLGNDPIRFFVTEAGDFSAEAGSVVTLPVEAINPGVTGNLPANSLVSIDGPLGLSLSVTNSEATRGGNDQTSPAPSPQDFSALRNGMIQSLVAEAILESQKDLNELDILLPVQETDVEILDEKFTPEDVQPATELNLDMRATVRLQVIRWVDLSGLARAVLDASLPEGFEARAEDLSITHSTDPQLNDKAQYEWQIQAQRAIQHRIDPHVVFALIRGSSVQQTAEKLSENFPLETPPEIIMVPGWWPWIPQVPFRIFVIGK